MKALIFFFFSSFTYFVSFQQSYGESVQFATTRLLFLLNRYNGFQRVLLTLHSTLQAAEGVNYYGKDWTEKP